MKSTTWIVLALAVTLVATGCSNKKLLAEKDAQIAELQGDLADATGDLAAERARTAELRSELEATIAELQQKEQVWMEEREGLMHITLSGEVAFPTASAELTPRGREIMQRIWDVVSQYNDRDILVEGHTDNRPIAPGYRDTYKSNWELSSARAHAVLHFVKQKYGIDPGRLAAVGYGEHRPVASNQTAEGRAANRRVVITIAPLRDKSREMLP